ncbi:MAG: hypothetical protein KJ749_10150, partial [Planctomycetes bacterium]|nr:hypothetical protein [Planctomycetota bacterium]
TRFRNAKEKLISSSEEGSLELFRQARPSSEGGPTVVGLLEKERQATASLASGQEGDNGEAIRRKRDQLAERISGDRLVAGSDDYFDLSLLDGMTALYEGFKGENALRTAAEERVAQLQAEVTTLVGQNAEQKGEFERRLEELTDDLARVEADRTAYRAERDEAVAQMGRDFENSLGQATAALAEARGKNEELRSGLEELRARFSAQQGKLGVLMAGPSELPTAREPDGTILSAVPGDEAVYINLGEADRLMLGLRFSVFSAGTGIPADGRSKAQVEVVSIAPKSAECRVVHVEPGEIIVEGDLVANPVYDPRRALTFLTVGQFDLDRDGEYDPDGRATIEAMITNWGGEITQELTALTDFIIVGGPPRQPKEVRNATPEQRDRQAAAQRAYDDYLAVVETARALSVPAMSQDIFLSFLGRSSRLAAR